MSYALAHIAGKVVIKLAKGQHRVQFVAKKPADVQVKFQTRDGETVKFNAVKEIPQVVRFVARDNAKG